MSVSYAKVRKSDMLVVDANSAAQTPDVNEFLEIETEFDFSSLNTHDFRYNQSDSTFYNVGIKASVAEEETKKDKDTGAVSFSPKFAPDGWMQRLHEIEFTTSTARVAASNQSDGAIHDKDKDNLDYGWSSCNFYEDIAGTETLIDLDSLADDAARQTKLDNDCIRTDFMFMPDVDYGILSGVVSQISIPTEDVYMWGLMVDLDAVYGGPQVEVLGGGLNLRYVDSRNQIGLKGVAASIVYYDKIVAPDGTETVLPAGSGTNRIRYIIRHSAGLKHRLQSVFEIFRP